MNWPDFLRKFHGQELDISCDNGLCKSTSNFILVYKAVLNKSDRNWINDNGEILHHAEFVMISKYKLAKKFNEWIKTSENDLNITYNLYLEVEDDVILNIELPDYLK